MGGLADRDLPLRIVTPDLVTLEARLGRHLQVFTAECRLRAQRY